MKLVLYSGGPASPNKDLGKAALSLMAGKKSPRFSFIPADSFGHASDFEDFCRKFPRRKSLRFDLVPVEKNFSPRKEKRLLTSDAIFLGGGNTFEFLHKLRDRGLLPKLKEFVAQGGVLMGLSAGSILMTPSIQTASVPSEDADDNRLGITNLSALGLVDFEFSPHYHPSPAADAELRAYSCKLARPIYACQDGSGLVVRDGKLIPVGPVIRFQKGRKKILQ